MTSFYEPKKFVLIGASGYVAPRHMAAIKETNNELIAVMDPSDSLGVIDKYFPKAVYFSSIAKLQKFMFEQKHIDYVSICSPNWLHDAHCLIGLQAGANIICEKPLVPDSRNLPFIKEIQKKYNNQRIYTILQLRLHPSVQTLKEEINKQNRNDYDVYLKYVTPRGNWYHSSWKGDENKSGGLVVNIGIHLFDMLIFLFGKVESLIVHKKEKDNIEGKINLEKAKVRFQLSTDSKYLPQDHEYPAYRSIQIDGKEFRFDQVFNDLHTNVYLDILHGGGFTVEDAIPSIELVSEIRHFK